MTKNNFCVIMAGGIGARFWPISRTGHPKQFIDILGIGQTLIQQTYNRFVKICPPENILVVTNEIYADLVKKQLPGIPENNILLEPVMRNTAPCIAYANYKIMARNPEANIVVSPSDHLILNEDEFLGDIQTAFRVAAENDWLLTLGIKPVRPETGYGYIQFEDDPDHAENVKIKKVRTFTEKPGPELAAKFIECGDFLWNAGIFIWSLKSIIKAFEEHLDDVDSLFKEGIGIYNTPGEKAFIREKYTICRKISIDYGIMEKATNVHVIAADFGWSDLGTWGSLYDIRSKDQNLNAVTGSNVMLYDSKGCIINFPDEKLVVIQGLERYIVVENNNELLICRMSEEQQIRQFVNTIKVEKGEQFI